MTHTVKGPASAPEKTRRIPPPSGTREPLKTNVFDLMTGAVCQLLPLFPYHDAGAIVPCGAIMTGDPQDSDFGHFFHYNTVEEVAVTWGANEAMLQSGQVFVTQQLHGVNSFLRNSANPEAFILMTITQHQAEDGDQSEAILFRCQKCHEQLVRFDYNATPKGVDGYDPSQWGGSADDEVSMFPTIWGSDKAAIEHSHESARTCPKCGHVNPEHPHHKWGWNRYVSQVRTAESAKRALRSAAAKAANEAKEA
jgi:DNA-directed RNA polymerase subunit M/transcription elongation factor TFIIS